MPVSTKVATRVTSPPGKKINNVLARFEETIEKNNAAGVNSGMYLTTMVSKKSIPSSRSQNLSRMRRSSMKGGGGTCDMTTRPHPTSSSSSSDGFSGFPSDKDFDHGTVSTAEMSDCWEPFGTQPMESMHANRKGAFDDEYSQLSEEEEEAEGENEGQDDSFGFDENVDFDGDPFGSDFDDVNAAEEKRNLIRRAARKEIRRSGRLGNRKTKTRVDKERSMRKQDLAEKKEEAPDGFAIAYVADEKKLQSFNSKLKPGSNEESTSSPQTRSSHHVRTSRQSSLSRQISECKEAVEMAPHRSSRRSSMSGDAAGSGGGGAPRRFVRQPNGGFKKVAGDSKCPDDTSSVTSRPRTSRGASAL